MPDDIDRAQDANEQFQADAMAAHQRQVNQTRQDEAADDCADCGEPIPEARKAAMPGCRRCVECQTMHEHWRAL